MKTPGRGSIIAALLKKELIAYSRDKLYLFLTVLTLVFVVAAFWLMPDRVDESITLGISPPLQTIIEEGTEVFTAMGMAPEQIEELQRAGLSAGDEGLDLVELEREEDLSAVIEGKLEVWRTDDGRLILRDREAGQEKPTGARRVTVGVGIALPRGFISRVASGQQDTVVTVYSDATVPPQIRGAMRSFVREAAYQLAGRELPVALPEEDTIILGVDRAGRQVSVRQKLVPMLAFMILLIETFAMASLISVEVLQRTVTAIMVTPARVFDFLASKSIFGTALALFQGLIVLGLVGAFTATNWSLLVAAVFIGAMMFTGVSMVVGSAGKDFLGQIFLAMLFTVPLIIPAFSVLFPGSAAAWVKALPTYPVLHALVEATIYEATWATLWPWLLGGLGWVAVLFGAGLFVLKRKVESL